VASTTVTQFRCGLYGRVSTKDKGQEVENQLAQLRKFAARNGWTIVAAFIDHESGKISGREQFEQIFTDASQRKFDVLLFWSLDRLSREGVLPTLQHLQVLEILFLFSPIVLRTVAVSILPNPRSSS
jgi:DNA invertase Pin-like site-specific DNA recombinase